MTRRGFTLIELVIVLGVVATLAMLASTVLLGGQRQTSVNSTLSQLIADIKLQQFKAMSGDTEGRGTTDHYGIYFASTSYTLFHGSSYSVSDPGNSVISPGNDLTLSTTFPSSTLVFVKGSGDVMDFSSGTASVTLSGLNATPKTIQLNRHGVIISQ